MAGTFVPEGFLYNKSSILLLRERPKVADDIIEAIRRIEAINERVDARPLKKAFAIAKGRLVTTWVKVNFEISFANVQQQESEVWNPHKAGTSHSTLVLDF